MNFFEISKIFSAVLLTIIVVMGINKVADYVFAVQKPEKAAYLVPEPEETTSTKSVSNDSSMESIKNLLVSANIEDGKKVFKKCAACHSINKGGNNKMGPALWNVVDRKFGAVNEYKYSAALLNYEKNWTFDELNAFLINPKGHIKGTKMAFAGLKKEEDRASVILYLNQNSDSPKELP